MICRKCGEETQGQFCSHCGAALTEARNDWSKVWYYIRDSVDVNKGFLRTLKYLMIRPGSAIRKYLTGEAGTLSNPMKVLFITGTIATFITANLWGVSDNAGYLDRLEFPDKDGYFNYSGRYFSFFSLDGLPVFALFSFLFFRKHSFNYIEHLLLNIYILGGQFLIVIIMLPGWIYYPNASTTIYGPLNVIYNLWVIAVIFKDAKSRWLKTLLACGIPFALMPILNYFLYRIAPKDFWSFLDLIFN